MRTSETKRKRGRPRTFESGTALAAAQATFQRKGYSATSLEDLCEAMNMNRPSIYAEFIDKQSLYSRSLEIYAERVGQLFANALDKDKDFRRSLRRLYQTALDTYVSESGDTVGCMVACTAVTDALDNPAVQRQALEIFAAVDTLIARRIDRAIADGDLPATINAKAHARLAAAILHSLAIRARSGTRRNELNKIANDAADMIAMVANRSNKARA